MNNLETNGFELIPSQISSELIQKINERLDISYEQARSIQIKNGIEAVTDGTIHHLLAYEDPCYIELLSAIVESSLFNYIKIFFNGNFILNSYGGLKNLPSKPSYVVKVHRDIRFFSGNFPLMLNMLIMLDDFTLENGATYLLAKSHLHPDRPSDEHFYEHAQRAIGKRGDVLFFNSNLWHAAGLNKSNAERRAITITFTKPFMKQQLDYPQAVGTETLLQLSPNMQQVIGYFSRTPKNLDEWYQVPEKRFYRPGQD
ncbi:MAG: phytanoyl-CoA dioxygenase family protein [Bacteroidota bacterium]